MSARSITREQPLRWCDTDALGHIWHGVHIALIEEARTALLNELTGTTSGLWDHVVVRIELDIRAELRYADAIAVTHCTALGCGRSSVRTAERIERPDGTLVAQARSVVVAWDPASGSSRALSAAERAALATEEPA